MVLLIWWTITPKQTNNKNVIKFSPSYSRLRIFIQWLYMNNLNNLVHFAWKLWAITNSLYIINNKQIRQRERCQVKHILIKQILIKSKIFGFPPYKFIRIHPLTNIYFINCSLLEINKIDFVNNFQRNFHYKLLIFFINWRTLLINITWLLTMQKLNFAF